jgi:non-canonical poly(A) RNA polymerase PAPD5/7
MVELIGSFASQLWIPSSDIDIMVIIPDCTNSNLFDEITDIFYNRVLNLGMHNSIRLLRTYKLPMIKLVLNQHFEKLDVEIFITGKKNIASRYVSYSIEVMTYYPEVVIIYYVLRRLFALQNLHDHRKGGFKAYALFLLIYSMRRQYQYSYVSQFL